MIIALLCCLEAAHPLPHCEGGWGTRRSPTVMFNTRSASAAPPNQRV
jgi:hypothetical protein